MTALRPTLAAAVLAAALTGCGAGLDAQTYQTRNSADSTDTAVGNLALRDIALVPSEEGRLEAGEDAEVTITVTNRDDEPDRLVSVTSPDAESVEVLQDGREGELEVPALGSTGDQVQLRLVGLTRELRSGEYVTMVFRFERNGSVETLVPVELTNETDRPAFTGEEGSEEGDPALQAPTGGHSEGDAESGSE